MLRQNVINAMPYLNISPSGNNNVGSNGYCATLQRDGLYAGAVVEGREHLKYNIKIPWISKSARFHEVFLYLTFSSEFGYSILIFILFI